MDRKQVDLVDYCRACGSTPHTGGYCLDCWSQAIMSCTAAVVVNGLLHVHGERVQRDRQLLYDYWGVL